MIKNILVIGFSAILSFYTSQSIGQPDPQSQNNAAIQSLMNRAQELQKNNDLSGLYKLGNDLTEKAPKFPYGWFWKGIAQLSLKDYKGALETNIKLVELSPKFAPGWNNLGSAYFNLANFTSAIEAYETAQKLDSKNINSLTNLWRSYQAIGNSDKAYEAYAKLKNIDPDRAAKIAETLGIPKEPENKLLANLTKTINDIEKLIKFNQADIDNSKRQIIQASDLIYKDKSKDAIPLLESAYSVLEKNLGSGSDEANQVNDYLIFSYADILDLSNAFLRSKVGALRKSVQFWQGVYQSRLKEYGETGEPTLRAGAILGWAMLQLGDSSEAKNIILKTNANSIKQLGQNHRTTLGSSMVLIVMNARFGLYEDVEIQAKKLANEVSGSFGDRDPLYFASQRFLASSYVGQKKYVEAVTQYEKVLKLSINDVGNNDRQTLSVMNELANAYGFAGRAEDSEKLNQQVYEVTKKNYGISSVEAAQALGSLAISYQLNKKYEKATDALKDTVKSYTNIMGNDHPTTISYKSLLATSYIHQKKLSEALFIFESIIPAIENLRASNLLSVDEKQSLFSKYASQYRLYALLLASRDPDKSFNLSELSKARTLLESTATSKTLDSGILDVIDRDRLINYQVQINLLSDRIPKIKNENLKIQNQAELAALLKDQATFITALKNKNQKYAQLTQVKIVASGDSKGLIDEESLFISYLQMRGVLLIYALDSSGKLNIKTVTSLKDFDINIERFRFLLSNSHESGSNKELQELSSYFGKILLEPISSLLSGKKKIIISPDGSLAFLPFETLRLNDKLFIENHDVSYIHSLSMLNLLKDRKNEYKNLSARKELLALGGAIYSSSLSSQRNKSRSRISDTNASKAANFVSSTRGNDVVQQAMNMLDFEWTDLPGSEKEVKSVSAIFGAKNTDVLIKSQASEQSLQDLNKKNELRNYKRLLFSTHGYLSPTDPNLSAIVLSQNNKSQVADGYLTVSEIPSYNLRSDFIFLSACDTGLGKVVQGEGILGIPFALYIAGNVDTIMTLWPIDDDSTAEFVRRFFTKVKNGTPESAALSQTKREFLVDKKYMQPVFWAPFVMYGY